MTGNNSTTGFLGFESVNDFLTSLLGLKTWTINAFFASLGALAAFAGEHVWENEAAVMTLWGLMSADWLTGVLKGMMNKKFSSYKFWRMPVYFVATSYILSISWGMSEGSLLFKPLPAIVICGFYSVYFISLLENLGEMKLLPPPIIKILKNRFGLKALFKHDQVNKDQDGQDNPRED